MTNAVGQPQLSVLPLGQAGFRIVFDETIVYIDPYLSDSVQEQEGKDHRRMVPAPFPPDGVTDADFVLITHIHKDHADPETLLPIASASPQSRFVCPNVVGRLLCSWGIAVERIVVAHSQGIDLTKTLRAIPVPAAHESVDVDEEGKFCYLGYVLDYWGRRIYHAGDTSPHEHLIDLLRSLSPIEVAFLPVNERSFFRKRRGIIGNMSVREAFSLASEIGVQTLVPIHWDMFAPNSVFREEIELLYRLLQPPFTLAINPKTI